MAVNEKYLDQIQNIITRHNSNSFIIKGWAITLCSGILALAGTFKEPIIAMIGLVPVLIFWYLDSCYLAQERCFISLYNSAINNYTLRVKNEKLLKEYMEQSDDGIIDFEKEVEIKSSEYSLNFKPFLIIARNNRRSVFMSKTIAWFYIMLGIFSILLFIVLLLSKSPVSNDPIQVSTKLETDSLFIRVDKAQVKINHIILNDSKIKIDTLKTIR